MNLIQSLVFLQGTSDVLSGSGEDIISRIAAIALFVSKLSLGVGVLGLVVTPIAGFFELGWKRILVFSVWCIVVTLVSGAIYKLVSGG